MTNKPSIPKGTRDFSPLEMTGRNYIFNTIRSVFERYGYLPIETPAMENLSSLLGKYGEEGDRLVFKVLNSGDFLSGLSGDEITGKSSAQISTRISDKGLRYDLTVPFARYVVQHRNDLSFPFKRYQIQPVWRADRPQKGRYREFYQCDVDVIGSDSMLNEVEMIRITDDIFRMFGMKIRIKVNNRKILSGITESVGAGEKMMDITMAMDKLEKIGIDQVNKEFAARGVSAESIEKLQPIIRLSGNPAEKCGKLNKILHGSGIGIEGLEEIKTIFSYMENLSLTAPVDFDLTLARGLNYYTGAIIEVLSEDIKMGSIAGGGRYDDLTGIFGMPDISGIGISYGADRIYDVLVQTGGFPEESTSATTILFVNFGRMEEITCLKHLEVLQKSGIKAELYPDPVKMKKQMAYANAKKIPYVALVGETEIRENVITLKEMATGKQQKMSPERLIRKLTKLTG